MPTPAPVNTASFTGGQLDAFSKANALGSGVQTTQSTPAEDSVNQAATRMTPSPTIPTPAAPKTAPPTEPTVLSSNHITDTVIPQNNDTAAALQQKGVHTGQDGNTYYADGSLAWNGEVGPEGAPAIDNPTNDPEINQINQQLGGMKAVSDASTKQSLDAVHSAYANRIAIQGGVDAQQNLASDAARANALFKSGTERYGSPSDTNSIMTAQERAGVNKVSALETQENALIAKITQAQQTGDMKAMSDAIAQVKTIRTLKQNEADKLATLTQTNNDKKQAQQDITTRDLAIADLFAKGTTDTAAILKSLTDQGISAKATDVAATIKALTPVVPKDVKVPNALKFTSAQLSKFYGAGLNADQIQGLSDYYNGVGDPEALSGLDATQQSTVHQVLNGQKVGTGSTAKAPKSLVSGSLNYQPSDISSLHDWLGGTKGSDQYVNPDSYLQVAKEWTAKGGAIKDFLKNFPISSWVNPTNTYVTPQINALVKQDAAATKTTGTKSTASSSGRAL